LKFSYEDKDSVKQMKVVVIGCGSIGSHVTVALGRIGVKRFILIDPDKVEKKNLRNQAFMRNQIGWGKVEATGVLLEGIDEEIEWVAIARKIQQVAPLIRWDETDVVIEAVDGAGMKRDIWKMLDAREVMWVGCNGTGGVGSEIKVRRTMCGWIVGDMETEANVNNWGVAPRVMTIGGMMAEKAVVEYLRKRETGE